jgi:hypothetical protein
VACGGQPPAADGDWVPYSGHGISFEHPSGWRVQTFNDAAAGQKPPPLVYLSNQPLADPCFEHEQGFSCDVTRLVALEDKGVVLTWFGAAGTDAPLDATKPGACEQIGGDISITGTRGGYRLDACARGRDDAQFESQVKRVFESVKAGG